MVEVRSGGQSHLPPFRNLGSFVHLTLPVSFGRDTKSRWALLYLVSMPGVVQYPTQGVSVLTNSKEGQL